MRVLNINHVSHDNSSDTIHLHLHTPAYREATFTIQLGLCCCRLETKASQFKQRRVTQPLCSSLLSDCSRSTFTSPSITAEARQRAGSLRGCEERKYSQNWKCGGVGACRSTTFQSRITAAACVGLICGQTLQGGLSHHSCETWAGCSKSLVWGHKGQSNTQDHGWRSFLLEASLQPRMWLIREKQQ